MPAACSHLAIGLALVSVLWLPCARADEAQDRYAVAAGHYAEGRWRLAAEAFGDFVRNHPNHPKANDAVFFLAETLVQLGQLDEAADRFHDYLAKEPDGRFAQPALFRAGESAYLVGKSSAAREKLEAFLAAYPRDPLAAYAWVYLGSMDLAELDAPSAETCFRRGLADFPQGKTQDECRLGLARALEKQHHTEEAERLYAALAAKTASPLADDAQFCLGALQYGQGRYGEALATFDVFQSRLAESRWQSTARLGRGWALLKLGRAEEARSSFEGIASDPSVGVEACYWLGLVEKAQKEWPAAAQTLLKAAEVHPSHQLASALRFHAGDALLRAGDRAAAAEQFDRVIASAPPDDEWIDDAMRGKVQVAFREEDYQALDRQAAQFTQRFPNSPLALDVKRMLGRSLLERQEYQRAVEVLEPLCAAVEEGPQALRSEVGSGELENPSGEDSLLPAPSSPPGRSGDRALRTEGWEEPSIESPAASPRPPAPSPAQLEDRYLLALSYEGLGRCQDALEVLRPVVTSAAGRLQADAQLTQASLWIELERFDEAIVPLEALWATRPTGDRAAKDLGNLAICYAETGQLENAKSHYDELVKEHPDCPLLAPITEQLAEAAYEAGDAAWSRRLFRRLVDDGRTSDEKHRALSGLAWSQYKDGQLEEAAATFDQLLNDDPDPALAAEAALASGEILQDLGRPDPALAMYDLVIDRYPNSEELPHALWKAALLRDALQQDREAVVLYQRLAADYPQFPEIDAVLYNWAWTLADLGRPQESIATFRQIYRRYPQSPYWAEVTFRLARHAFQTGQPDASRRLVAEVLAAQPSLEIEQNAVYLEGQIAAAEEKWEPARQAFERLLQKDPEDPLRLLAEYALAESLFRARDYQAASERLEQLLHKTEGREEPWLAIARLRLAQARCHQKEWDEACDVASKIETDYPDFEEQYEVDYVIGRCRSARAEFDRARQSYRKVIESPQGEKTETAAKAQFMIAESYFHQKDYEAALREYLALEILYDYPTWQAAAVFQAAKCHELSGRWNEAVDQYTRLLATYPDTRFRKEAAERLEAARGHAKARIGQDEKVHSG